MMEGHPSGSGSGSNSSNMNSGDHGAGADSGIQSRMPGSARLAPEGFVLVQSRTSREETNVVSASEPSTTVSRARGNKSSALGERERFYIFIKILFQCLQDTTRDATELRLHAKRIALHCIQRNRQGDPAYMPLMSAMEARLRVIVGDDHWNRAGNVLRQHVRMRRPPPQPGLVSTSDHSR